ncbi:MAG TPA: DUF4091 domain-containing protein [Candidatus Hydrogenedentes bacterium]|nr:DUF4091 domain-containing protein [Candidatus Hydrogenedentota bacterium]
MSMSALFLWAMACAAGATAAAQDPIALENEYIKALVACDRAGVVAEFTHRAQPGNVAGSEGLLQEGFGAGSLYVPNRRLNEQWSAPSIQAGPATYSYECDGPNIRGLHVVRTVEAVSAEASLRICWRIENRGDETQWVTPWARSDLTPGGTFTGQDRLDFPSLSGIHRADRTAYYPASRNWIAATDPLEQATVYAVFNADHLHSFLTLWAPEEGRCGFQAAFLPRLVNPGDTWETTYRLNLVRGLAHVDFASDELALQVTYSSIKGVEVFIAPARVMADMRLRARIRAKDGQRWALIDKHFDADLSKVIRCSYDWHAPEDGAYEFLAQLEQDGRPYPLGVDTGSPHGGIDTQFIVGDGGDSTLEPWTDAPHALERQRQTLRRALAHPGAVPIWFESSLDKVFREDAVEPTGAIESKGRIALARNERESIQIVLRPPAGKDLRNVVIRPNNLVNRATGARIAREDIQVFTVAYHPVRVPSYFEGPTGQWPDALPPLESFNAPGGQCSPVWLTVYAAPEIPPGDYAGIVEVAASNLEPVELWLEATVYDFTLPATPALKTDFGFLPGLAFERARTRGYSGALDQLEAAYLENGLAHRVTLRPLVQFPRESTDYAAELERFARRLDTLDEAGASSFAVPASLLDVPQQLRRADAFVVERGLENRVFCEIAFEPPPAAWPRVFERMQHWRDNAPHIPLMATTVGLEPFVPGALDIWALHMQVFDTPNNRLILEEISKGKEAWGYVNYAPPRPYGNLFIDFAAIEHRILLWQAWALGLRGFHYAGINAGEPGHDPWLDQLDVTPVNGDRCLVYPGASGPVSSIRWETLRDGIEDYDYLVLLMARIRELKATGGHDALLEQAAHAADLEAVVKGLVAFSREPGVLYAKRREIAEAIVAMEQVLGKNR